MNIASKVKTALRNRDNKMLAVVVNEAKAAGFTERECFRFALAQTPDLAHGEWADMLMHGADLLARDAKV